MKIVKKLFNIRYIVVAVTYDLGSRNLALWDKLQIDCIQLFPLSKHPSDDQIIFFCRFPHLLNLIRNHFIDSGFKIDSVLIDKNCFDKLLQITSTDDLRICLKLTSRILQVKDPEHQRLLPAAQLFSDTAAKTRVVHNDEKLFTSR